MRLPLCNLFVAVALIFTGCASQPITGSMVSSPYQDLYAMEEGDIVHLSTGRTLTEDELIDYLATHRVVYVGESHDSVSDHAVQLKVVQRLVERYPGQVAVGLEMMRRPFQDDADKWIAGELTEKEFMRVWVKNWGSSWPYYSEMLTWLRDQKVPIVALNRPKPKPHGPMPKHGIATEKGTPGGEEKAEGAKADKATKGDEAEKSEATKKPSEDEMAKMMEAMPEPEPFPEPEMDEDDPYYAAFIGSFFHGHGEGRSDIRDMFVKAQMKRDETMAESAANFLADPVNGDKKLIVLAGGNHVRYGFGIPRRVFRRVPDTYVTLSPMVIHFPEDKLHKLMDVDLPHLPLPMADFAWLVPYKDLEDEIVKLGVGITDSEEPVGVRVTSVVPESSAEKAGFAVDDVIVDVDGVQIKEIFDLTYELAQKTVGDAGKVKVVRDDEPVELDVTYAVMPKPEEK